MSKRTLLIKDSVTLPCSGCDGEAKFTAEGENPTFFHTMPYCKRFDDCNSVDDLFKYFEECKAKAEQKKKN